LHKRKILYCKKVNPKDFLKCNKNCMLTVDKQTELKGCIFGKSLDIDWVVEDSTTKGNITCNKCSTKKKRVYIYDKINFYDVGLWVCYSCGEIGYSVKDSFSKGTVWNLDRIEHLFKCFGKDWWLELFAEIDMFNKI
jgi:hypothetical protein